MERCVARIVGGSGFRIPFRFLPASGTAPWRAISPVDLHQGRSIGIGAGCSDLERRPGMDQTIGRKIKELLDHHRLMTVATNRPDGWPQATTVGYVNDGMTIYFLCGPESQKAQNLARDNRVSLTIDHDVSDPMAITGLSMAAHAHPVTDPAELANAMNLLVQRYPEYASFPMPKPEEIRVFRVEPKVISVLDYSKGFGHTDLVTV
jgi:nitroimidazol reductase NimA-like FMN-containing flavoprotein (pyridoxamine 5'-phosphate oxidase superfamily)